MKLWIVGMAILLCETTGFSCYNGIRRVSFTETSSKISSSLETVEDVKRGEEPKVASPETKEEKPVNKEDQRRKRKARKRRYAPKLKPLSDLTPGTEIPGTVDRVLPYGVMVRIGYATGTFNGGALLHISQISEERVEDPRKLFKRGQAIKARVAKVDRKEQKVFLSLRAPRRPRKPISELKVGDEVEGKVKAILDYGFFVDAGYKSDILVHISRISSKKVNDISDFVEEGQRLKVRIINVDNERKTVAGSILGKDADMYMDMRSKRDQASVFSQILKDRIDVIAEIESAVDAKE